jgi:hypothetical protein
MQIRTFTCHTTQHTLSLTLTCAANGGVRGQCENLRLAAVHEDFEGVGLQVALDLTRPLVQDGTWAHYERGATAAAMRRHRRRLSRCARATHECASRVRPAPAPLHALRMLPRVARVTLKIHPDTPHTTVIVHS